MTITLIDDPSHVTQVSPEVISRWLATECPNNFRLRRADWAIVTASEFTGSPAGTEIEVGADYTGIAGDSVTIVDNLGNAYSGLITGILDTPARTLVTDIDWAGIAGTPVYMNDNTLYDSFYFEGRLTVNGVVQSLTVIASPDVAGEADLDVSGLLRIMVSIGKTADYTALLAAETNKGGAFTFAYRGVWIGSNEAYTEEGNTWYYAEAVRSIEQGSNLYPYVPTDTDDAPFFNSFVQPVYFLGFPFDVTFLMPELAAVSPAAELSVVINYYSAANVLLTTSTTSFAAGTMEGRPCSLNIDPASIPTNAAYLTAEIFVL